MTSHLRLWGMAGAVVLGGCEHRLYEVDMTVEGDEIARSIRVSVQHHGPGALLAATQPRAGPTTRPATQAVEGPTQPVVFPRPVRDAAARAVPPAPKEIARIYGADPAAPQPWKARFRGRTPGDVGGAGEVACFRTALGSAWAYLERFGGRPDPASGLQSRLEAADTVAWVVAGWARTRLGDRPGFARLGAYLDGDFHKDLKNLSLLLWAAGAVRGMRTVQAPRAPEESDGSDSNGSVVSLSSAQMDVAALCVQYLVERKYVDLEDAPTVLRIFHESDARKLALVKGLWRKFLTRKIALTDRALVEHLVSIPDRAEEVAESLVGYVRRCREYKQHLARVRKRQRAGGPPSDDEPTADGFLAAMATRAFAPVGINLLNTDEELRLTLATGGPPAGTNGTWSSKTGKVFWHRRFRAARSAADDPGADPLPAVCYAVWARPNEQAQTRHFGRAILRRRPLLLYCLWRNGLTPAEAEAWDAFVAALKPATAAAQLASSPPATTQPGGGDEEVPWATEGRRMLEEALNEPPPE